MCVAHMGWALFRPQMLPNFPWVQCSPWQKLHSPSAMHWLVLQGIPGTNFVIARCVDLTYVPSTDSRSSFVCLSLHLPTSHVDWRLRLWGREVYILQLIIDHWPRRVASGPDCREQRETQAWASRAGEELHVRRCEVVNPQVKPPRLQESRWTILALAFIHSSPL